MYDRGSRPIDRTPSVAPGPVAPWRGGVDESLSNTDCYNNTGGRCAEGGPGCGLTKSSLVSYYQPSQPVDNTELPRTVQDISLMR
jgi:hypothetical protein